MLKELNLKNLALIDQLSLEFRPGLNIISGETGAGKSLIITALALLTGRRANPNSIGKYGDEAIVEGVFQFDERFHLLANSLTIHHIDCTPKNGSVELLIRRSLSKEGKNRIVINNQPATLAQLAEIGKHLIDIAGQFDFQVLLDRENHVNLLDEFANIEQQRMAFKALFDEYQSLNSEIERVRKIETDSAERRDFLSFQLNDILSKDLAEGEEEKLELEHRRLSNAATLTEKASEVADRLYNGEGSVYEGLSQAEHVISELRSIDSSLSFNLTELKQALEWCMDTARALDHYREHIDFSQEAIQQLSERMQLIHELKRKYKRTVPELIEYRANLQRELSALDGSGQKLEELSAAHATIEKKLKREARALSEVRLSAKNSLEKRIHSELKELKLPHARLNVSIQPLDCGMGAAGIDDVEFYISMNPGQEFLPLKRTISGGELSRLFLATKTVISAKRDHPITVFDEIDSGVGGDAAKKIGLRLQRIGRHAQVICITHLPQIAVFGDQHLVVDKRVKEREVNVEVSAVDGKKRVEEIARMLGEDTQHGSRPRIAFQHAEELLNEAKFK